MEKAFTAVVVSLAVFAASAATCSVWAPPGSAEGNYDGNADVTGSWGTYSTPASETTYLFNAPGSYTVGLADDFTAQRTIAVDNGADVTLDFSPYVWNLSSSRMIRIPFSADSDSESALTLASGTLTNISSVSVGNKENAPGGRLTLEGANSRMFVTDNFYVGNVATGAYARVTDGALLSTKSLTVGNSDSGNSTLLVDGGAAVDVTGGGLTYVGGGSSSNTLCVVGKGTRVNVNGQLRAGTSPTSVGNLVVIADGAAWTNSSHNFIIGYQGSYNVGMITNGVNCKLQKVYVGGAKEAYGNYLLVSGSDTTVSATEVYSGMGGNRNRIRVDAGASVSATTLQLNRGTDSQASGSAESFGNVLEIDGQNTRFSVVNPPSFGYTNNEARVTVSGGACLDIGASENYVYVGQGQGSCSNVVEVVSGGIVTNQSKLAIGNLASCSSNIVRVSGTGSLWRQTKLVKVGATGSGNDLRIEDGATWWQSGASLFVGYSAGSSSNTVTVTGRGSLLNITNQVFCVGYSGKGNKLVVSDGATCYAGGSSGAIISNESAVVVSNGRLLCQYKVLMMSSTLELSGAEGFAHIPQLNLLGSDCTLRFVADRNGLPELYIRKPESGGQESNIKVVAASGGRIEIDATKCRVRGAFTLFDSANPMPEALRSNIVTTGPVSLEWSSDYKKLTATTTPSVGFVMLVR